jgi:competence protein ComEC
MIHYYEQKIMVTGDLLEADELEMVEYYKDTDKLKCDILKVAHHGSKSSSSEAFLDAVKPRIAVIQCGRNNFYGHPHKQTLERLEDRGIRVFRTDISGAVGIDIHGENISVDLYKEAQK